MSPDADRLCRPLPEPRFILGTNCHRSRRRKWCWMGRTRWNWLRNFSPSPRGSHPGPLRAVFQIAFCSPVTISIGTATVKLAPRKYCWYSGASRPSPMVSLRRSIVRVGVPAMTTGASAGRRDAQDSPIGEIDVTPLERKNMLLVLSPRPAAGEGLGRGGFR